MATSNPGLYKRGDTWHYEIYFKGKRYRGTTNATATAKSTGITAARKFLNERRREIEEGVLRPKAVVVDLTLGELADKFLKNAAPELSLTHYTASVKSFRDSVKDHTMLSEIGTEKVERWFRSRAKRTMPRTVNGNLQVVRRMFNKSIEWGYSTENPTRGIKKLRIKRRIVSLNDDHLSVLYKGAASRPWLADAILFAHHTGARRGELLKLRWKDVDLERGFVTFRDTKSGTDRDVPLGNEVRRMLSNLATRFGAGVVFRRNDRGGALSENTLHSAWRSVLKAAGNAVPAGVHFHDLRHAYAQRLVHAGLSPVQVRDLMGHASITTTELYFGTCPDSTAATAVAAIDGLRGRAAAR